MHHVSGFRSRYMISFLLLFSFLYFISCEYQNVEINNTKEIKYSRDIVPILTQHCNLQGCHINGATTGDFTNYDQLKEKINSGKFQRMVFEYRLMPPVAFSQLSGEEYLLLKRWVDGGAGK
jgi:hypothetical protein